MLQHLLGFFAFLRICSYHADGQLHHDKAEVLVDIKAADFRVISASIRHQRPAEELGLKCSPRPGKEPVPDLMSCFFS